MARRKAQDDQAGVQRTHVYDPTHLAYNKNSGLTVDHLTPRARKALGYPMFGRHQMELGYGARA